jgi:hypothetical protein
LTDSWCRPWYIGCGDNTADVFVLIKTRMNNNSAHTRTHDIGCAWESTDIVDHGAVHREQIVEKNLRTASTNPSFAEAMAGCSQPFFNAVEEYDNNATGRCSAVRSRVECWTSIVLVRLGVLPMARKQSFAPFRPSSSHDENPQIYFLFRKTVWPGSALALPQLIRAQFFRRDRSRLSLSIAATE